MKSPLFESLTKLMHFADRYKSHLVGPLKGYAVSVEPEHGSQENRADPFAAQCEHGFVKLLEGSWNQGFVEELFPNGAHDQGRCRRCSVPRLGPPA